MFVVNIVLLRDSVPRQMKMLSVLTMIGSVAMILTDAMTKVAMDHGIFVFVMYLSREVVSVGTIMHAINIPAVLHPMIVLDRISVYRHVAAKHVPRHVTPRP